MKKLYILGIALSMVAFGTQSVAQVKVHDIENTRIDRSGKVDGHEISSVKRTAEMNSPLKKTTPTPKDDDAYFSEDFSNGFDGQGENGAWTVGGPQGALWFHTYPVTDAVNGYDPNDEILGGTNPLYGNTLPIFFGDRDVVNSPTRDNGVMMIDVDRYNSLSTIEDPFETGDDLDDYFVEDTVRSTLISPPIDLTGYETAYITFYQGVRLCCSSYQLAVEVSYNYNEEQTWESFEVFSNFGGEGNAVMDTLIGIDITPGLQDAQDVSNVRVRFNWIGDQTTYYWTIDDFAIGPLTDNDITAGYSFTNNWATYIPPGDEEGMILLSDINWANYMNGFEYETHPEYYTRPYKLGQQVTNSGALLQQGIVLKVTGTSPSGGTLIWESEPIELEQGATDTIWIDQDVYLTDFPGGEIEVGEYTFAFEVWQDVEDDLPGDNYGYTHVHTITNEANNAGRAIMQNENNLQYVYIPRERVGQTAAAQGKNMLNSTGFVFPELEDGYGPKFITHIETIFINTNLYQTIPGRDIFFNIRKNHIFNEVAEDPSTWADPIFGTWDENNSVDYEDEELRHEITQADIQGEENWVSLELPNPVAIEPGVVYLAEIRIPQSLTGPIVYILGASAPTSEIWGSLFWVGDGIGWQVGGPTMAIRFRTAGEPDGIEEITYENGLTLIQNYPNPFTDMTRIQYSVDKTSKVNFEVRDLTGKLVYSKDLGSIPAHAPHTFELQRGNLAAGMYTYTISTSEYQVSRKLIIQ